MKLLKHREDIRDLEIMQGLDTVSPHALAGIARRYLNLIRMAEEALGDDSYVLTLSRKRVLKDTGGK